MRTKQSNTPSIWRKVLYGMCISLLTELILLAFVAFAVIKLGLPYQNFSAYCYVVVAVALCLGVMLCHKKDKVLLTAAGVLTAVALLHVIINIVFFSGQFNHLGFSILAMSAGCLLGCVTSAQKKKHVHKRTQRR